MPRGAESSSFRAPIAWLPTRLAERTNHETYFNNHWLPQSGERGTKAHRKADVQLALWNFSTGISAIPATIGTLARMWTGEASKDNGPIFPDA